MSLHEKNRILLINPKYRYRYNWDLKEVREVMGRKSVAHPLSLPLLAAITPDEYEVEIIDENTSKIPRTTNASLVGITGYINSINRAYEIADYYRKQGKTVVMGGPHVSFNTSDALEHADAILVNEAEQTWHQLLADYRAGQLQKEYRSDTYADFEDSALPRWDLVKTNNYLSFSVQVSRGCPFSCEFCVVRDMFGGKHRYRNLDNVMAEIENLPPDAVISFADDNLTANRKYLHQLLERLKPLNRNWSCQASIDCAYDPQLLIAMADAGCNSLLIGFETLDAETLKQVNKHQNKVERYAEAIRNVHAAGMHIIASFVVGFDNDTPKTLDTIFDFTQQNQLSYVMINALCAFPGSRFDTRLTKEGKVFKHRSEFVNGIFPTIRYQHFTQQGIFDGLLATLEKIYAYPNLEEKARELFSSNPFQDTGAQVSAGVKWRTSWFFAKRYIFTFDTAARRFFRSMLHLIRVQGVPAGVIIQYMLFVESFRGYLKDSRKLRPRVMEILKERDRA